MPVITEPPGTTEQAARVGAVHENGFWSNFRETDE